jgi:hypothetical protein
MPLCGFCAHQATFTQYTVPNRTPKTFPCPPSHYSRKHLTGLPHIVAGTKIQRVFVFPKPTKKAVICPTAMTVEPR